MTVGELIEVLEGMPEDAEVRLAQQPRWAFEYSIQRDNGVELAENGIVYIAEGTQLGYLPGDVASALGWS